MDFKEITFFSDHFSKIYNVDSAYINKLLGDYTKNSIVTKEQVFDVLRKLNNPEPVIQTYNDLFEHYDKQEINEDIFSLKHQHFTQGINNYINDVASEYHVSEHELQLSAAQYKLNSDNIPNISGILNSKNFEKFKLDHPEAKPLKFGPMLRRYWKQVLDEKIIPLKEEL